LYNLYIILSSSLTLSIPSKESTLLDKLFFSVLASCTVISLFNELPESPRGAVFQTGVQRYALFSNFQTFSELFFKNLENLNLSASLSTELMPLRTTPLSNGSAKVDNFSLHPNFFAQICRYF